MTTAQFYAMTAEEQERKIRAWEVESSQLAFLLQEKAKAREEISMLQQAIGNLQDKLAQTRELAKAWRFAALAVRRKKGGKA